MRTEGWWHYQANLRGASAAPPSGTHSEPRYKQAELDLLDLILDGNQSQNPFHSMVTRFGSVRLRRPQTAIELAAVNLSPQTISVNVIGEVKNPGLVQLPAVLLGAGGDGSWRCKSRANTRNVELVRINRNGSATLKGSD